MSAPGEPSFAEQVGGRKFDRYLTAWHACACEADARQAALLDHTAWEQVEITPGLEIIHNDRDFALWSDERVTWPVYRIPHGGSLSADAASLLRLACGADWASVEGGLASLARVAQIVKREPLPAAYREFVEKIELLWCDGTPGTLYTRSTGQFEGYRYEVFRSAGGLSGEKGADKRPAPE